MLAESIMTLLTIKSSHPHTQSRVTEVRQATLSESEVRSTKTPAKNTARHRWR